METSDHTKGSQSLILTHLPVLGIELQIFIFWYWIGNFIIHIMHTKPSETQMQSFKATSSSLKGALRDDVPF